MKFSQRYGHLPVRTTIQVDGIDEGLRNRLWNLICEKFFSNVPTTPNVMSNFLSSQPDVLQTFKKLWHDHFKWATDTIGHSYIDALKVVREHSLECQWYEVYDLLEFFVSCVPVYGRKDFIDSVNEILKQEIAGYRFVSGRVVQITSEEEIVAVEQALGLPDSLKPVSEHLRQSLALLADKKSPDYRNSIKESISAIESLSKIISGLPKATLGPALSAVEKKTELHAVLKEAFQKLYGYTNDAQGIRHALMDEPTLDIEDAKFMLVSCSAFVNYLVVKAQKAGIKL